ncbi:MAG: hypothetical protein PUB95_05330 [Methanobrevibacter ruminantium]|uniref:hypothetical protein n=1 Tax=Methanobrevibacter ruminantium TaxID=83816 RepID=UPI0026EDEED3|nr:hypothetical protein [Methanobrevibacter ruminantium]MDD6048857.1 hypothetical protein [Methanobrevibacter ruminantium]
MSSGLFILMDGEESVKQCINKGVYGFFMPPVFEDEVNSRSKHYAVLVKLKYSFSDMNPFE